MNNYSPHNKYNVSNRASPVLLYQVVYRTRLSLWVVLLLLVSFCLQPLRVDASEVVAEEVLPPQITDDLISRIDDADPEPLPDTEIESALESVTPPSTEESNSPIDPVLLPETTEAQTNIDAVSSPDVVTEEVSPNQTSATATAITNNVVSTTTDEIPPEPIDTGQPPNTDTGTTTTVVEPTPPLPSGDLDVVATATSAETASTTEPVASTTEIVLPYLTVESDQVVQFDKTDCVAVADGSYYCRERESKPATAADGLFSLPDATGDLEIFLQRDGLQF